MATIRLYIIEITYANKTMLPDRFWAESDNYVDISGHTYTCKGSRVFNLPDELKPYMIRSIITDRDTTLPVVVTSNKTYILEPATSLQNIGEQLGKVRKTQGITQKQLAEMLGTHQSNIARIESGKDNISINQLAEIAAKLGKRIELV